MDTEHLIKATQSTNRLIQNEDYYKYIFKKTERIVSVVFYITQTIPSKDKHERLISDLEDSARDVHNSVLRSLQARAHVAEEAIQEVLHTLVGFESKLVVAQAANVFSTEVMQVMSNEIDSVLRALNKYSQEDSLLAQPAQASVKPRTTRPANTATSTLESTSSVAPHTQNRRARIKTIIEAKGEVSIKDVTDIITDISEKTIQRELNAMIEDNEIKRIGERRWSKYVLF